jgi:hypothetical protein
MFKTIDTFRLLAFVPASIFLIIIVLELSSCSDEITSSGDIGFDSARFLWKSDTIFINGLDPFLYTPDTISSFIVGFSIGGNNRVICKKNNSEQSFEFNSDELFLMLGNDIYNSFLFGVSETENLKKPLVWKWSGNGFDKISTNFSDSNSFRITCGLYVSPAEMWIGCLGGLILKFDGNDFQKSNIPDSLTIKRVFLDRDNKLKTLAYYFNYDVGMTYTIFEYKNSVWEKIYTGFYARSEKAYDIINKDVFAYGEDGIYSFDGQNLHKVIEYYKMSFLYRGTGTSLNDFIGIGRGNDIPYQGFVFHWNGKKWSKELRGFDGIVTQINKVTDDYYTVMNQNSSSYLEIYKGRRK